MSDCEGGNPCENGGSCSADPAGGYRCSCARGYAGMHCQTSTEGKESVFFFILLFSLAVEFALGFLLSKRK